MLGRSYPLKAVSAQQALPEVRFPSARAQTFPQAKHTCIHTRKHNLVKDRHNKKRVISIDGMYNVQYIVMIKVSLSKPETTYCTVHLVTL